MDRIKYYTGIGSRKVPDDIRIWMRAIGQAAAIKGYILRSGAADGADAAFERGCDDMHGDKDIYLPWRGFNGHHSQLYTLTSRGRQMAEDVYKGDWNRLSEMSKKFMTRNCYQVLGRNLDARSDFVVCWTPDGATTDEERSRTTGGTGQAISVASINGIPVFNLYHGLDDLIDFMAENDDE